MPPMQVRNADTLNHKLGLHALPLGFVSVPIYNFKDVEI